MRASIRSTSCGSSLQIHSATSGVEDRQDQEQSGSAEAGSDQPAVTAAAPAMNSALMMLFAAMMRARDASSLRLWMIA